MSAPPGGSEYSTGKQHTQGPPRLNRRQLGHLRIELVVGHFRLGCVHSIESFILTVALIKFLAPRVGHSETGVCVCRRCQSNMRMVGIEAHPLPNVGADLFTYECICGELRTSRSACRTFLGSPAWILR